MSEDKKMAMKQEIRDRLDCIMANKEKLALYPPLDVKFIKDQVAAVRDYLSNTACVAPSLDYVHREFIKIDLFDAVNNLCMVVVNPWNARECPRPIRDALCCLDRWKPPVPVYSFDDPQWHGRDGKDRAHSKDKMARIWQQQQERTKMIIQPKVVRLEAPKPQASNPAYGERVRKRKAELDAKMAIEKEAAMKEIETEMKRRRS